MSSVGAEAFASAVAAALGSMLSKLLTCADLSTAPAVPHPTHLLSAAHPLGSEQSTWLAQAGATPRPKPPFHPLNPFHPCLLLVLSRARP